MDRSTTNRNAADSLRFRRCQRMRSRTDFRRAYERRCSVSDGTIIVAGCENALDHARLGLSVSRKLGGAVARNRRKRLIREAFRLSQDRLPAGIDLVVIPRADVELKLGALLQSLPRLAERLAAKLARTRK